MAYRFEKGESIPSAVRRIIKEQAKQALSDLESHQPDTRSGVHGARKSFKRSRSLLRLVRDDLGKRNYRRENRFFRDAGRKLSEARDAEAMVECFDQLVERYPEILDSESMRPFREELVARSQRIASQEPGLEKGAADVSRGLRKRLRRIDEWPLKSKNFSALSSGFERSYRQGRKAFRKAYRTGSAEDFHEWRKRIKDYWHYSRLLQSSWPGFMQARSQELKVLGDLIGQDHDLSELQKVLASEADQLGIDSRKLGFYTEQRQDELRHEAHALGASLYAVEPAVLLKALRKHWKRWKRK